MTCGELLRTVTAPYRRVFRPPVLLELRHKRRQRRGRPSQTERFAFAQVAMSFIQNIASLENQLETMGVVAFGRRFCGFLTLMKTLPAL